MLDQKDRESREALVEHWANLAFLSFRYSQGNAGLRGAPIGVEGVDNQHTLTGSLAR